jgi:hypothetical protein
MSVATDPRLHPQILAALSLLGGGSLLAPPPVTSASPLDEVLQYIGQVDAGTQVLYDVSLADFGCYPFSQQKQNLHVVLLNAVLHFHPALLSRVPEFLIAVFKGHSL